MGLASLAPELELSLQHFSLGPKTVASPGHNRLWRSDPEWRCAADDDFHNVTYCTLAAHGRRRLRTHDLRAHLETSLQELVPEAFGRVVSLDLLGSFALLPLSYFLVGWIADQIGGVITITIFALIGLAIVASVLCVPAIRRFQ